MDKRRRRLGRDLEPIFKTEPVDAGQSVETLQHIKLVSIQPSRYQPRTTFDPDRLAKLVETIRSQGVVQPVVLRPIGPGAYELIAGERRWRAAQMAELDVIPAIVREINDQQALALALIENVQREDLNPMDEARALRRLVDEFELSHREAADAVGRSRVAVSNLLRLLDLDPQVQAMVVDGALEMGHARALLALEASVQREYALRVAKGGLSVRRAEQLVRSVSSPPPRSASTAPEPDPAVPGTWRDRVHVVQAGKYGTELRLRFLTDMELREILAWLSERDTEDGKIGVRQTPSNAGQQIK